MRVEKGHELFGKIGGADRATGRNEEDQGDDGGAHGEAALTGFWCITRGWQKTDGISIFFLSVLMGSARRESLLTGGAFSLHCGT
jgi:hypothetical protein